MFLIENLIVDYLRSHPGVKPFADIWLNGHLVSLPKTTRKIEINGFVHRFIIFICRDWPFFNVFMKILCEMMVPLMDILLSSSFYEWYILVSG